MQKTNVLAAGIALLIVGCNSPSTTETYRKVKSTPKAASRDADPSGTYAEKVHATLKDAKIEHKVVTFEYEWTSRFTGVQTAERTAVVYRDPDSRKSQWWLAEQSLRSPVWLPDTSIDRQVAFFVRRPATVVETREYGADSGKSVKPLERSGKSAVSKIEPPAKPQKVRTSTKTPTPKPTKMRATPTTTIQPPVPTATIIEPASKATPAPVPTAKPILIDQPDTKPDPDLLGDPKPLPATKPNASARPNFFQRIAAVFTGILR